MARKTYVFQTNADGSYKQPLEMVEKHLRKYPFTGEAKRFQDPKHHVIGDIEPYQSTIDGSYIGSRSKHRTHLRDHGCVEIGTESIERAESYFKKSGINQAEIAEEVKRAYQKMH